MNPTWISGLEYSLNNWQSIREINMNRNENYFNKDDQDLSVYKDDENVN